MKRPPRPAPADLVREARRCEIEARQWQEVARVCVGDPTASMVDVVYAYGKVAHWQEEARRWESMARAACGPLRWAWWCRRHRLPATWPMKVPR